MNKEINRNMSEVTEKNVSSRDSVIVVTILMLLIISISIGFAYLSSTLRMSGVAGIPAMDWDIHFENAVISEETNIEDYTPVSLSESRTSLDFGVTLSLPKDKFAFDVEIVNSGTIDAMISDIDMFGLTDREKQFMKYKVTYFDGSEIQAKDLIRSGERKPIHIEIEYLDVSDPKALNDQTLFMNLNYDIKYIQADETAILRDLR